MHRLLRRQLRKHLGKEGSVPEGLETLLQAVTEAYDQYDADRKILQRSMEISSDELLQANDRLREEAHNRELILSRLKESIRALKLTDSPNDLSDDDVLSISRLLQEQIEERNVIEEALREREQRLQLILESMPDCAVFTLDPDGIISSWNEGARRMTGFEDEDVLDLSPDFFDVDGEGGAGIHGELETAALTGHASEQGWWTRKDGSLLWVEATLSALRNQSGTLTGFVTIARNMTGRRRDEEALRVAKEAAESASRAKSMFLANMSHEIRTPMNAVIGMTGLLEETRLSEDQREMVETIQSSGSALLSLINDILDLSKIEAGKLSLQASRFDFQRSISSTLEVFAPLIKGSDVRMRLNYAEQTPKWMETDETRLRQILFNLIGNAVKFTRKGDIVVSVTAQTLHGQTRFHVSVRDTGIGIAQDMVRTIFKPFSQVEPTYTRSHGGTGLGLTISKRLVEALGGEIWVESQLGEGSTFHFTFVAPEIEEAPLNPVQPASDREPIPHRSDLRVLVAEDNPTNRKVISKLLERIGQTADLVENGEAAVDAVQTGDYDVVFMDVQMPVMNGLEATRAIRKLTTRQPHIIALTANAMPEDRANCLEAGMDEYLAKPVVLADLKHTLAVVDPRGPKRR